MTIALFSRVGTALYGAQFHRALARDLGVSERTVSRWLAGANAIPDGVWNDLGELLTQRRGECVILLRAIRRR